MEAVDLRSILQSIPYKVLVSMEDQQERRGNALNQLKALGIDAEWVAPARIDDIDWNLVAPAFRHAPRYGSHAMTLIRIFEEAIHRRAGSFMHIEDDVIFQQRASEQLSQILVPEDWKFIYLGGRSWGPVPAVSHGLVRSGAICDLHAVAIRSDMIDLMKRALAHPGSSRHWCDTRISFLHRRYPAYLCRPNLAWQSAHLNDEGTGEAYTNYFEDGRVKPGCGY